MKLPRYDERRGWVGSDPLRLYTFTDKRTGQVFVRPGNSMRGIGPAATVAPATRSEAEAYWQNPLHGGWKVLQD